MERNPEFSVFRPHKPGLQKMLGDLEAQIMEIVWKGPDGDLLTVRDVLAQLNAQRDPAYAYTTIMTVMGNLARKGLLIAHTEQQTHRYAAALSQEAFTQQAVSRIVDELLCDFTEPTIAHFARRIDPAEPVDRAKKRLADYLGRTQDARTSPQPEA